MKNLQLRNGQERTSIIPPFSIIFSISKIYMITTTTHSFKIAKSLLSWVISRQRLKRISNLHLVLSILPKSRAIRKWKNSSDTKQTKSSTCGLNCYKLWFRQNCLKFIVTNILQRNPKLNNYWKSSTPASSIWNNSSTSTRKSWNALSIQKENTCCLSSKNRSTLL